MAPDNVTPAGLTIEGWIMMCVSIGLVLSLVSYCLGRVLLDGSEED